MQIEKGSIDKNLYNLITKLVVFLFTTFSEITVLTLSFRTNLPINLIVEEPGFKNVKNKHFGMSPF